VVANGPNNRDYTDGEFVMHEPASVTSLRQSFLAGLLALLPLFITWKILSFAFLTVDSILGDRLNQALSAAVGRDVHVPGLGLITTGLLVILVGYLTRKVFFKQILVLMEELIERIPFVRQLYNASRQLVVPFTDRAKLPFSQVVLVEYPMPGRFTIGLLAKEHIVPDGSDDRVVVFFPSNHLHLGYPVVLHRDDVTPVDMSVEEAIKFFVSCGVVGDDKLIRSGGELLDAAGMAVSKPARTA